MILAVVLLMAGTLLTTTAVTTMVPAAYAGGDNDDENQQKAEDESQAALADCENDVKRAGFDCIATAANDVEIEEEIAQLSVTKTVTCSSTNGIPSDDDVCNWALALSPNSIEPSDYQITVTGNSPDPSSFAGSETPVEVSIGPGEYTVSEIVADTSTIQQELNSVVASTTSIFTGDCNQADQAEPEATGIIAAGESQQCNIDNQIFIFEGTVPQD